MSEICTQVSSCTEEHPTFCSASNYPDFTSEHNHLYLPVMLIYMHNVLVYCEEGKFVYGWVQSRRCLSWEYYLIIMYQKFSIGYDELFSAPILISNSQFCLTPLFTLCMLPANQSKPFNMYHMYVDCKLKQHAPICGSPRELLNCGRSCFAQWPSILLCSLEVHAEELHILFAKLLRETWE